MFSSYSTFEIVLYLVISIVGQFLYYPANSKFRYLSYFLLILLLITQSIFFIFKFDLDFISLLISKTIFVLMLLNLFYNLLKLSFRKCIIIAFLCFFYTVDPAELSNFMIVLNIFLVLFLIIMLYNELDKPKLMNELLDNETLLFFSKYNIDDLQIHRSCFDAAMNSLLSLEKKSSFLGLYSTYNIRYLLKIISEDKLDLGTYHVIKAAKMFIKDDSIDSSALKSKVLFLVSKFDKQKIKTDFAYYHNCLMEISKSASGKYDSQIIELAKSILYLVHQDLCSDGFFDVYNEIQNIGKEKDNKNA